MTDMCKTICNHKNFPSEIVTRTLDEAHLILEHDLTIRQVAEQVGWKKSTVHRDIHKYLPELSIELYKEVREVLITHKTDPKYNINHRFE